MAKQEKLSLAGAVAFLLISSSVTMSVPYCIGRLIDMLNVDSSTADLKNRLSSFCQILVVVFSVGAAANFGRVSLINMSSYRIVNRLRRRVYDSIVKQEIAFFDKTKTGELINRLSTDASVVGLSVTNNVSDGLRSAFTFIAGASLMAYTAPHLAFVGLVTVSPVAIIAVLYGRYLKNVTRSVQDSLAASTEVAEERISNIRIVQAFAKEEHEKNLYKIKILDVLHFSYKESLGRAVFFGLTGFSGNLIILTVLYYGGLMMHDAEITVGDLSSFLMYAAYVGISIGGMSSFYAELMRGLGASSRLWQLIDRQPSINMEGGITVPPLEGNLLFHDVSFTYPSRPDAQILSNLNLSIPAGEICAVVGPSGSGKSTLGALLLRFYDPNGGAVMVDGKDVREYNIQWLRENIGLVSQEPVLFSCSIRENLLYGASDPKMVSDLLLQKALEEANAWQFINTFPNGIDTIVGERGVLLSGGQRQRIAIARAILKNPKILILDEATSALDSQSEFFVQSALEKIMQGRTVITIAHRLSTIRKAHHIVVLDQGHVAEEGTYEELLKLQGMFYNLIQHQRIKI